MSHALARVVRSDASCIMWQDRQGYLFFYFVKDLVFPLTSHDNCHCEPQPCSPTYVPINDKKNISDSKEILHSPDEGPHYPSPREGPASPPGTGDAAYAQLRPPLLEAPWHSHISKKKIFFFFPVGVRNPNVFWGMYRRRGLCLIPSCWFLVTQGRQVPLWGSRARSAPTTFPCL